MSQSRFQPSLAATLATLVVMVGCVGLGLWQLDRAGEKREWQTRISSRAASDTLSLARLLERDDPAHFPVRFTGKPDNAHHVLLDNRVLDGVAGYHVLTPVRTPEGITALVNRGWVARGRSRQQLPEIADLPDPVTVVGTSYIPGDAFTLESAGPAEAVQWPLRVQSLDMARLEQLIGTSLAPFQVRVAADHPLETGEQMPRVWHDSRLGPARHQA